MGKIGHRIAAGTVAAALLHGAVWGTAAQASAGGSGQAVLSSIGPIAANISTDSTGSSTSDAITKAIQQTSPSVVAIIGRQADAGADAGRFALAHGTGVVVRSDGLIITNAHVVKDIEHIVVVTSDGKQYSGQTIDLDEESDLALVKIDATGLKEAVFADKAETQVGETVIAIGTPISFSLRNSVTVGVISGLDRSVNSTYRLLQTDAAINPGNSGGALVNVKGEVVGINTLKVTEYGVDNLGFAIPADTVQYVLKHFLAYGKVKRPYVGIDLEESWAAVVGIPSDEPLSVSYVEAGSPADKAGIKSDDKLLSVGGTPVKTLVEFNELLKNYLPGDTAVFSIQSGGKTQQVSVTFGETTSSGAQSYSKNGGGDFDSDAGKTRIGNSRYGWSMKYPSGLDKYYQSKKGNTVTLGDAKGEYALKVTVEEKQMEYTKSSLLKLLSDKAYPGSTILERKYVEGKNASYARIICKDDEGYYEERAYVHGDYIYYVTLAINSEKEYINSTKRKGFTDLLDSFSFTFDKNDPTLKDIAVDANGLQRFMHEDYGYSFSVPSEWSEDSSAPGRFEGSGGKSAEVTMSSMADGDTLSDWAKRTAERITSQYAAAYVESGSIEDTKLAGLPAKKWTVSVNGGDKWYSTQIFFVESGGYKYRLDIDYPKDMAGADVEALVGKIKDSFELNGSSVNASLGYVEDEDDLVDYSGKVEFSSKELGYALTLPAFWEKSALPSYGSDDDGSDMTAFRFTGGWFSVIGSKNTTYEDELKQLEKRYNESAKNDADYKVEETDTEAFGVPAKLFTLHYISHKIPYEQKQLVFSKNGVTYVVTQYLSDIARTDANLKALEDAFRSMRFKDE